VGLGWSLNAGGMISRKTRGLPDDSDIGQAFLKLRQSHTFAEIAVANEINYTTLSSGCWDAEPDEFFFNVNGYSGEFAFDWSVATNIKISSKFPVRIAYFQEIANSNAITKWQLTTPDGYMYSFSSLEKSQNKSSYTGAGTCRETGFYTTSWYLSQVINLNNSNEHVDFTYQDYSLDYDWVFMESKTFGSGECGCSEASGGNSSNTANRTLVDGLRISQIKLYPSNITADFISTNDRQDLVSTYQTFNLNNKTLDFIQISYDNGSTIEKYALNYFYQGDRLMLQTVQRIGTNNIADKPFEFTYNTTTLPARNSKSIDAWGYYNGKTNTTLLPKYVNGLSSTPYYFLGADRSPDFNGSKAQVLENITYPTGGSTEFVYEGHEYAYIQNATVASLGEYGTVVKNENAEAIGSGPVSTWQTTIVDFHLNPLASNSIINISINSVSSSCQTQEGGAFFCFGGAFLPRARIYKFNTITNQYEQIYSYTHPPASAGSIVYFNQQVLYEQGDYRLIAEANHSPINPPNIYDNINISLNWQEIDYNNPVIHKKAGGLRIKEVKYFDNISAIPKTIRYLYNSNNLSSGVINGEPLYTDGGYVITNCGGSNITCPFTTLVGSGNIIFGETNGTYIGYREVTSFETGNGKIVSKFNSPYEFPDVINFQKPFGYPASFDHKTGMVYEEVIYNEAGNSIKKDLFEYDYSQVEINSIKVSRGNYTCNYSIGGGNLVTECPWDQNNYWSYYASWSEPLRMGFSQLKKQSTFQDGLWTEKNFTYDNNLKLLTQENYKIKDATSNILTTTYKYPGDENQMSGLTTEQLNAITTLKNQNRYLVNLENITQRDGTNLNQTRHNYKTFDNGQVNLESVAESQGSYALELRFKINKYDIDGNILDQNKFDDHNYAYIWDYSGQYLIAQAVNSTNDNIAYTSFEANGTGNWTFNGGSANTSYFLTGIKSYNLSSGNSITKSFSVNGNYIVSYWSMSGSMLVNGSTGTTGATKNGWTYYEHTLSDVTSVSLTGIGIIDELRLYPRTAMMSTYAYEPLIGIISLCDTNSKITYYDYDAFGRLVLIRDNDQNIIKKICYNYAGQVENCN